MKPVIPKLKEKVQDVRISRQMDKDAKKESRNFLNTREPKGFMKDWNPSGPEVIILREPTKNKIFFATFFSEDEIRFQTDKGFVLNSPMKFTIKRTLKECHEKIGYWAIIGKGKSRDDLLGAS